MAHYQYTLVKTLQMKIHVLYLGEQHGKGACDRLFGWANDWLQDFIQRKPVHGIQDLIEAFQQGSAHMMHRDPHGPSFLVKIFEPGKWRPSVRLSFSCPTLKISRTYSLTAELNHYAPLGVTVRNNVFSDLVSKESLCPWSITETVAEEDGDEGIMTNPVHGKKLALRLVTSPSSLESTLLRKLSEVLPCRRLRNPSKNGSLQRLRL